MKRQGLILQVRKNDALILSEDHDYLKIRRQPGFAIGQTVQFSLEDVIQNTINREGFTMKKKWVTVAASVILVAAVGVFFASFGLNPQTKPAETTVAGTTALQATETIAPSTALAAKPIVAVLAIDINPSLELKLAVDGTVVAFQFMNQDAEKLQFGELIGMPADAAVEAVVAAAKQAGFINSDDEVIDYVVLAEAHQNAATAEAEPLYAMIQNRLQERIKNNVALQNVEMVMLRATEQQMIQAHKDNIGLGLHVMNQASIQANLGEAKTVREFFANQERLQLAQQEGYMWQGQYGGSEEGPGQGTQQQSRATTGTSAGNGNQGETTGPKAGDNAGTQQSMATTTARSGETSDSGSESSGSGSDNGGSGN